MTAPKTSSTFKLIVAGSRGITSYAPVREAIIASRKWHEYRDNLEIVSGMAKGVDLLGVEFAKRNNLRWHEFPADWDNLDAPGAVVRYAHGKPYNVKAGFRRNVEMGLFSDGLVAVWDGKSRGTQQMIEWSEEHGLFVYVHKV